MEENIKNKVREIQSKYCSEPVETKLYYAIKETIEELSVIKDKQEKKLHGLFPFEGKVITMTKGKTVCFDNLKTTNLNKIGGKNG